MSNKFLSKQTNTLKWTTDMANKILTKTDSNTLEWTTPPTVPTHTNHYVQWSWTYGTDPYSWTFTVQINFTIDDKQTVFNDESELLSFLDNYSAAMPNFTNVTKSIGCYGKYVEIVSGDSSTHEVRWFAKGGVSDPYYSFAFQITNGVNDMYIENGTTTSFSDTISTTTNDYNYHSSV
jgi:hypothetical protein